MAKTGMAKNGMDICRPTSRDAWPKEAVRRFAVRLSCYFKSVLYVIGFIYGDNI